jgi:uncharacterized protein (DUF1501 family)
MNTRRRFLARSTALGAAGLAARMAPLGLATFHPAALAQSAPDYKALVCVFLYGGVDGNSLVIPNDAAGYGQYAAIRSAASGLNIARAELLGITASRSSASYGLHPALAPIHPLFAQKKLAIVANVGPLAEPTTRADYRTKRPDNLFSHSDQQAQWQASLTEASATGWGGRIADALGTRYGSFPVVTSLAGSSLFVSGKSSTALALPSSGGLALSGFSGSAGQARLAALQQLLAAGDSNAYVKAAAGVMQGAVSLSGVVNPILTATTSAVTPFFTGQGSGIAQQLQQVAKLIEARAQTGARRQVFFVSLGGFDTHTGELATLDTLLGQLAPALKGFHDATVQLGVSESVTTFTLSDFGRTMKPASGAGTDHAWGNHHFVLGGAVRGGDLYGGYPTLALGGPDDAESEGRWIPTTSVDQYGAALARWFGLGGDELAAVFPHLDRFGAGDTGFLG